MKSALLFLVAMLACADAMTADRWRLMARHGECHDVGTLKRKLPELGDVRDPDALVALMRRQGLEATSTPVAVARGQAREVRVPARELALLFVTAEACAASAK